MTSSAAVAASTAASTVPAAVALAFKGKSPGAAAPGKPGAGAAAAEKKFEPVRRQPSMVKGPQLGDLVKANKGDIEKKAQAASSSLQEAVMATKIDDHVRKLQSQNSSSGLASRRKSTIDAKEINAVQQNMEGMLAQRNMRAGESVTDAVEGSWSRMTGNHLSIAQQAELAHVKNMIECLEKSLKQYRQAEQQLLMSK